MESIEQLKAKIKYHYILVVNGEEVGEEMESITKATKLCTMLQNQYKNYTIELKIIKIK